MEIRISDYSYTLNDNQIAKFPVEPRDHSRLLVYKNRQIEHTDFYKINNYLPANSHLVFNNTKVIPARIFFNRKSGATIEVFLLNPVLPSDQMSFALEAKNEVVWECTIGNKKKWKTDESLETIWENDSQKFSLNAHWHDREKNLVKFTWSSDHLFFEVLEYFGKIPLPPYMNRDSEAGDAKNYQTVYSQNKGAVAAPTAGLHFTENVLDTLKKDGHELSFLTLHVGAGTFMPVKTENAIHHPMHCEQLIFSLSFVENLLQKIEKVIAVGTTSMRSLESLYWFGCKLINNPDSDFFIEKLYPYEPNKSVSTIESLQRIIGYMKDNNLEILNGYTEIMIVPGYEFKICKGLITNFHQPESTLLLLVAALIGTETWKKLYQEALSNDYRFLSYGDSSLLLRD